MGRCRRAQGELEWLQKETAETDRLVEGLALPMFVLSYEELAADATQALQRLGAFLEIEGLSSSAAFSKATDDRLENAVADWRDVRAAREDTPWKHFAVVNGG